MKLYKKIDIFIKFDGQSSTYAIAATHRTTGQRLLVKVSSLATREQLLQEIKRMNAPQSRHPQFIYTLTTEGASI